LRDEYTRTIEPACALAADTLNLGHTLSDQVNQAYGLEGCLRRQLIGTGESCGRLVRRGVLLFLCYTEDHHL
jgi:hypothetical protein